MPQTTLISRASSKQPKWGQSVSKTLLSEEDLSPSRSYKKELDCSKIRNQKRVRADRQLKSTLDRRATESISEGIPEHSTSISIIGREKPKHCIQCNQSFFQSFNEPCSKGKFHLYIGDMPICEQKKYIRINSNCRCYDCQDQHYDFSDSDCNTDDLSDYDHYW